LKRALALLFSIILCTNIQAQVKHHTRILLILDCSGSMYSKWGKSDRIAAAKTILIKMVDSLRHVDGVELALRCYGNEHTVAEHDCKDTHLEVPFKDNNADEIIRFVKLVKPNGWTPIAYSLTMAANDFPDTKANNVIILLTDGIEECDGDPCAVSQNLQAKKIILKPFIVGLGITDDLMKSFDCVGRYYSPKNEKDLKRVFNGVVSQALDNTTAQVNLLDEDKKPVETNVEMTFYNSKNNAVMYNFYHTMNSAGVPDTLRIDPLYKYNIMVNTLPPVSEKNVIIQEGKHNIISIAAPQGTLALKMDNDNEFENFSCLVRKAGTGEIISVQKLNSSLKYITGQYDLEILTLPRTTITGVKINQHQTQSVEIPKPGKLTLTYPHDVIGSIYVLRNNKHEWVADISAGGTARKETFLLQPGSYKVVYRGANAVKTEETYEQEFKLQAGGSAGLSL